MSSNATRSVFYAISGCPNVNLCLPDGAPAHPCRKIVKSQETTDCKTFQLPEPWVGQIDVAPILFVSSNPSIGKDDHADGNTDPKKIWESHHLAFGGGSRAYIVNGTKTTRDDGSIIKSVKYWESIKARAQELFPNRTVQAGLDYAITETVHCKSEGEFGIEDALDTCAGLYMERVLAIAAARVVVIVGSIAKRWFLKGVTAPSSPVELVFNSQPRIMIFIPHPNARGGVKSIGKIYSEAELERLRTVVGK
jgi:hypothetical protein